VVELTGEGRPVLVGTTDVETSELLSKMLRLRGIRHNVLNAKEHAREAEIVAQAGQTSTVTIATNMAGRGTDIKLSPEVKKAGGLAIVGTERHDSRRVDRQLRGRSGRQGDPGSSEFFISLEDKLMRLFGSERIAGVVDKLGMKEDDVLVSSMLSSQIERAQRKVEENNFGIRKRLLEYDDVMNNQRGAVYARRRNALSGERIEIDVQNMMLDTATMLVSSSEGMNFEDFSSYVMGKLSIDPGFDADFYESAKPDELVGKLYDHMQETYGRRMDTMSEKVYPFIKQVYEKQGSMYKNIAIPISDGRKMLTLSVDLEKAYNSQGKEIAKSLSRSIILYQIDEHWKQHLRDMDDLRQSVQNAAYEQKDPLVVYKIESYNLFESMLDDLNRDVLSFLLRSYIPLRDDSEAHAAKAPQRRTDMSRMQTTRPSDLTTNGEQRSNAPVRAEKRVGRNDPCPCGSGKKYKNCHGKDIF
ncbi:MAG: SEC-C domain-containing protein, partial [Bacteroidales bacterium]|nr:SEC-C domain-containing protein [Bacteroidales bacterium]